MNGYLLDTNIVTAHLKRNPVVSSVSVMPSSQGIQYD
jgi:hypothetical protein